MIMSYAVRVVDYPGSEFIRPFLFQILVFHNSSVDLVTIVQYQKWDKTHPWKMHRLKKIIITTS